MISTAFAIALSIVNPSYPQTYQEVFPLGQDYFKAGSVKIADSERVALEKTIELTLRQGRTPGSRSSIRPGYISPEIIETTISFIENIAKSYGVDIYEEGLNFIEKPSRLHTMLEDFYHVAGLQKLIDAGVELENLKFQDFLRDLYLADQYLKISEKKLSPDDIESMNYMYKRAMSVCYMYARRAYIHRDYNSAFQFSQVAVEYAKKAEIEVPKELQGLRFDLRTIFEYETKKRNDENR